MRPATPEDEPFLLQLYVSTRGEELLAIWDAAQKEVFMQMQFRAQKMGYAGAYPNACNEIIVAEGEPVGRILTDRSGQEFVLVDIALLPEQRGKGIGSYLITQLLAKAATVSKPVTLQVLRTNPARRLYERLRFIEVGKDEMYYRMTHTPDETPTQF